MERGTKRGGREPISEEKLPDRAPGLARRIPH